MKSSKIEVIPSLQVERLTKHIFLSHSQYIHLNLVLLRMSLSRIMFQLQKGIKYPLQISQIELFLKLLQFHRIQLLFSNIQGLNHR